jgi:hypothetical protein
LTRRGSLGHPRASTTVGCALCLARCLLLPPRLLIKSLMSICPQLDPVEEEDHHSTLKDSEQERESSEEASNNDAPGNGGSSDESFSTPRPRSLMELATPQSENVTTRPKPGSTKPPYHVAFKTPISDRYANEIVKKPRVGGGVLASVAAPNNKPRKAFRRPLADSEEKTWRHGRLSFSSTFSDDSPQVRGKCMVKGRVALRKLISTHLFECPAAGE